MWLLYTLGTISLAALIGIYIYVAKTEKPFTQCDPKTIIFHKDNTIEVICSAQEILIDDPTRKTKK